MASETEIPKAPENPRRYTWPWFLLAAVILGIILAVLWMGQEVRRMRLIRDANAPAPQTNQGVR